MKSNYVEEAFPKWFMLGGELSDVNGTVTDPMTAHNKVVTALTNIAVAWSESDPKAFTEYWYEET